MNLRVRPRVTIRVFLPLKLVALLEELFLNKIMIIVSYLTTLAHFKVLYPLACSLLKVAAPRFSATTMKTHLLNSNQRLHRPNMVV